MDKIDWSGDISAEVGFPFSMKSVLQGYSQMSEGVSVIVECCEDVWYECVEHAQNGNAQFADRLSIYTLKNAKDGSAWISPRIDIRISDDEIRARVGYIYRLVVLYIVLSNLYIIDSDY